MSGPPGTLLSELTAARPPTQNVEGPAIVNAWICGARRAVMNRRVAGGDLTPRPPQIRT